MKKNDFCILSSVPLPSKPTHFKIFFYLVLNAAEQGPAGELFLPMKKTHLNIKYMLSIKSCT